MNARRATTPEALAFATMFGLAPHLAELLAELADGGPRTALRVHVCALRRAMEPEAIDTTPSGYQLTEVGLAECRDAQAAFTAWVTGRAA